MGSDSSKCLPECVRKLPIGRYAITTSTGLLFGLAFEKSRVVDPSVIRDQMLLTDFTFLKFFLSAVAAGIVSVSVLSALPATREQFLITYDRVAVKRTAKSTSAAVVGGLVSGAGMAIAGSCPVTVFSQIGSRVPNVGYTFLGGLSGTLFYGLFKPAFDKVMQAARTDANNPWRKTSFLTCALPVAATLSAVVLGLELYSPSTYGGSIQTSWPPYCAGALIGLLQLPLVYFINQPLGGSTSLLCMLAQGFVGPLKTVSPFIAKFRTGFTYWWQIFFVSGAVAGSYLSASSAGALGSVVGVTPTQAFTGGALMYLGARIAGGCTSGHGFSGVALMSSLSATMITSMFGGAIATAMLLQKQNLL